MTRISAKCIPLLRWVVPGLVFAYVLVVAIVGVKRGADPVIHFSVVGMAGIIMSVVFKRRVWGIADEVLDGGDVLADASRGFGRRGFRLFLQSRLGSA